MAASESITVVADLPVFVTAEHLRLTVPQDLTEAVVPVEEAAKVGAEYRIIAAEV